MSEKTNFASRSASVATGLGMALAWAFGFGLVGAVVGAVVGRLTERPDEFLADLDPIVGAIIGFPIGGVVGLLLFAVWALSRPNSAAAGLEVPAVEQEAERDDSGQNEPRRERDSRVAEDVRRDR